MPGLANVGPRSKKNLSGLENREMRATPRSAHFLIHFHFFSTIKGAILCPPNTMRLLHTSTLFDLQLLLRPLGSRWERSEVDLYMSFTYPLSKRDDYDQAVSQWHSMRLKFKEVVPAPSHTMNLSLRQKYRWPDLVAAFPIRYEGSILH